ncbi:hypothetical protein [Actinoplanes awajinensis]|uniref:Uncharacterized protein n=1 Tax=Actinoplanes awajinensis subsp. mycoplanecinus TaxID=135947 RepID=A0A0X3V6M3_9ACTN|nr:hypothetical protein [Actinoplanes awajinensis]KUL40445.1 hypothetical protein ADL15_07445 [Actinoplanes awajinensis subsp. mycoplanecinus]
METTQRWLRGLAVFVPFGAALLGLRYLLGTWLVLHPRIALGALVTGVAGATAAALLVRRHRRRRMTRAVEGAGWSPIDPRTRAWPWQGLQQGRAVVETAWTRKVDGLPIAAGRVRFSGAAFAGAVRDREGWAIFVVLKLPRPAPSMAWRLPFQYVGDSPRLHRPELRWATLHGEIPPWTVLGDELFIVEPSHRWITPADLAAVLHHTLHVLALLNLDP